MWPKVWLAWALVGAIVETAALAGRRVPKDTLSKNLQWLLMVRKPGVRWVTLGGYVAGATWLGFHLWA